MNSLSQRSTRENTISREPADLTTVVKSKPEAKLKPAAVSYDYEEAVSQPDIPTCSEIDNNTRCSDPCDVSSTPNEKAHFFPTCGKMSVTIRRRGIGVKSKARSKRITKARTHIGDIVEMKRESKSCTNVCPNTTANQETPPANHQVRRDISKELTKTRATRKQLETAVAVNSFESEAICKETANLRKDGNPDKTVENARLCVSRNKASKIPRMKPNFFLPVNEEFRVYPV